jgi:hypothetical protein
MGLGKSRCVLYQFFQNPVEIVLLLWTRAPASPCSYSQCAGFELCKERLVAVMAARSLPACRYGASCYRTNAHHRAQFFHPPSNGSSSTPSSTSSNSNNNTDSRKRKADTNTNNGATPSNNSKQRPPSPSITTTTDRRHKAMDNNADNDDVVTTPNKRGRVSAEVSLPPTLPTPTDAPSSSPSPTSTDKQPSQNDNNGSWDIVDTKDDVATQELPSTLPPLRLARQATYIADAPSTSSTSSPTDLSSVSTSSSSSSRNNNNGHHHHRTPPRVHLGVPASLLSSSTVSSPSTATLASLGSLKVSTPIGVQPPGGGVDYTPSTSATWAADISTRFGLQLPTDFIAFWDTIKQVKNSTITRHVRPPLILHHLS